MILSLLEASKSLVFLSYWSFAKVHGPNIPFVESLMKARGDLDRSDVSEVMESVKRKVKEENIMDRKSHFFYFLTFYSRNSFSASPGTNNHETDHHPRNLLPTACSNKRRISCSSFLTSTYPCYRFSLFHLSALPVYLHNTSRSLCILFTYLYTCFSNVNQYLFFR